MAQAAEVAQMLTEAGYPGETVPLATAGDRGATATASPAGMKGLWTNDIVEALLRGEIDLAVHSAKDLPAEEPDGVVVAAIPPRASPWDVLLSRTPGLAEGDRVGSSSLRRRGQLANARPHLKMVEIRGNVDTRLRKLEDGEVDGLVLAAAGLMRLGVRPRHAEELVSEEMVPAPGQGALALQTRADDPVREVVASLEDRGSRLAFEAERHLVRMVGGGCALPLGAHATVEGRAVRLVAAVVRPDGTGLLRAEARAPSPQDVAREVADLLMAGGAAAILDELR